MCSVVQMRNPGYSKMIGNPVYETHRHPKIIAV